MALTDEVIEFAVLAHGEQKYGDKPYHFHLQDVVNVLESFGVTDEEILQAAWLHDILEDTEASYQDVESLAGKKVADIVEKVTDAPGANRAERKAGVYAKIVQSREALVVKMADRISNVQQALASNPRLYKMYSKEHDKFREALYDAYAGDSTLDSMKAHLDSLLNA